MPSPEYDVKPDDACSEKPGPNEKRSATVPAESVADFLDGLPDAPAANRLRDIARRIADARRQGRAIAWTIEETALRTGLTPALSDLAASGVIASLTIDGTEAADLASLGLPSIHGKEKARERFSDAGMSLASVGSGSLRLGPEDEEALDGPCEIMVPLLAAAVRAELEPSAPSAAPPQAARKIMRRMALSRELEARRARGERIVFTNGVFDLMHMGHVRYLQQARGLGDCLVVGVNADATVRRLKGPKRPLTPEMERARLLAALAAVDYVTLFEEETPEPLLRVLKPDVHVKGGDYRPEDLPEATAVREYGGEVRILPFLPGRSSTGLIEEIVKRYG
jgi:D-beta-D-heptose 7-phosphate kinase/D-beta-D-heptose 1-phosphate adenosyltransferase